MKLNDPDTFVQWYRIENPGENPTWESQCGQIEQLGFGEEPSFQGFVSPNRTPLPAVTTFSAAKRTVEQEYQKTNTLVFADY